METIYTGNSGQKLFIYNYDNFIYLRWTRGTELSRTVLLCNDYSSGFSSTVFNNCIHFSYLNLHRDLILKNVMSADILYRLPSENLPDYNTPLLLSAFEQLILLYFITNPLDNTFRLHIHLPLAKKEIPITIPPFPTLPIIHFLPLTDKLILSFQTNPVTYYCLNSDEEFYPLCFIPEQEYLLVKSENELSRTETSRLKKQQVQLQEILKQKEAVIENIRMQYETLMNTALQYKNEASKWYNKYYDQLKKK